MKPFASLPDALQQALEAGHGLPLVSVTVECADFEPAAVFGASEDTHRILWHQPESDFALVGIGATERFEAFGRARFDLLSQARRDFFAGQDGSSAGLPLAFPVALTALSFSSTRRPARKEWPLPDAMLQVPRLLFLRHQGRCLLNVTLPCGTSLDEAEATAAEAGRLLRSAALMGGASETGRELQVSEDVDAQRWQAGVQEALEAIAGDELEKVVLARTLHAVAEDDYVLPRALRALAQRYDHCTVFAYAVNGLCFLGATPERLLRLEDGEAQVDCLAGSIAIGTDNCDTTTLARRLLADPKERHEHELVVRAIETALKPLSTAVETPPEPSIKSTADVQHLHTPVSAHLRPGADIFKVVESLHPTPAMGGYPRTAALPLLRRIEDFDRGWYAGPCGWVDAGGNGEFVVGIRSALVQGNDATLFAGAGIVAGSDPQREYEETNLKLQAMLWALRQA